MTTPGGALQGFDEPVGATQQVFRRVLQAMSRPGRVVKCGAALDPPAPLGAAAAAVLLTLADRDTPVWLDAAARSPEVEAWLRFNTGAPIVDDPGRAAFAVIADAGAVPPLATLCWGTDAEPETGCTAVIEVAEIDPCGGIDISGPGIERTGRFWAEGPSACFWVERSEMRAAYPRGVDLVFTCGRMMAALPRTTRLEL